VAFRRNPKNENLVASQRPFHFHFGWMRFIIGRREPPSMDVDTIRTEPESEPESADAPDAARHVVDVSDLRADRIEAFADGGAVHLERRGGRTYLVADG
jgi:hypothetical protein